MEVTLAHSPDADDAYMFYALALRRIDTGSYEFHHILKDIESLNHAAAFGKFSVTALSFHNYPFVAKQYQLVSCGASVGDQYGPIIVSREPYTVGDFRQGFGAKDSPKVIAIPGERTTAFLALKIFMPEFRYEVMPFDQILNAVNEGRADAGLVIHEGQLSFAREGLKKVVDLGVWWREETGLPLPLGGNAIRRDLGATHIFEIARLLKKSIEYSLDPDHQAEALDYSLQFARGLDRVQAERFVRMYVNKHTIEMDEECAKALDLLYRRAWSMGLIPSIPTLDIVKV